MRGWKIVFKPGWKVLLNHEINGVNIQLDLKAIWYNPKAYRAELISETELILEEKQ